MNERYVHVLQVARKSLALWPEDCLIDNRPIFICTAVGKADAYGAAYRHISALITERLGAPTTLDTWLHKNGHITGEQLKEIWPIVTCNRDLWNRMQRTRLAWIDSLIEEFSK